MEDRSVIVNVLDPDSQGADVGKLGTPVVGGLDRHVNNLVAFRLVSIENLKWTIVFRFFSYLADEYLALALL